LPLIDVNFDLKTGVQVVLSRIQEATDVLRSSYNVSELLDSSLLCPLILSHSGTLELKAGI